MFNGGFNVSSSTWQLYLSNVASSNLPSCRRGYSDSYTNKQQSGHRYLCIDYFHSNFLTLHQRISWINFPNLVSKITCMLLKMSTDEISSLLSDTPSMLQCINNACHTLRADWVGLSGAEGFGQEAQDGDYIQCFFSPACSPVPADTETKFLTRSRGVRNERWANPW